MQESHQTQAFETWNTDPTIALQFENGDYTSAGIALVNRGIKREDMIGLLQAASMFLLGERLDLAYQLTAQLYNTNLKDAVSLLKLHFYVLSLLGREKEAKDILQRLLTLCPTNPWIKMCAMHSERSFLTNLLLVEERRANVIKATKRFNDNQQKLDIVVSCNQCHTVSKVQTSNIFSTKFVSCISCFEPSTLSSKTLVPYLQNDMSTREAQVLRLADIVKLHWPQGC